MVTHLELNPPRLEPLLHLRSLDPFGLHLLLLEGILQLDFCPSIVDASPESAVEEIVGFLAFIEVGREVGKGLLAAVAFLRWHRPQQEHKDEERPQPAHEAADVEEGGRQMEATWPSRRSRPNSFALT